MRSQAWSTWQRLQVNHSWPRRGGAPEECLWCPGSTPASPTHSPRSTKAPWEDTMRGSQVGSRRAKSCRRKTWVKFTWAKVLIIATAWPSEDVRLCHELPPPFLLFLSWRKAKLQCMLGYKWYSLCDFQIEEMKAAYVSCIQKSLGNDTELVNKCSHQKINSSVNLISYLKITA